jgi:hypothetical protein
LYSGTHFAIANLAAANEMRPLLDFLEHFGKILAQNANSEEVQGTEKQGEQETRRDARRHEMWEQDPTGDLQESQSAGKAK